MPTAKDLTTAIIVLAVKNSPLFIDFSMKKLPIKAKKGVFSPQCYQTENPDNPKCLIKANIDKVTDTRLYYYPGCAQYKYTIVEKDIGEDWFCTEKEAQKAGFEKAKTCHEKFNPKN